MGSTIESFLQFQGLISEEQKEDVWGLCVNLVSSDERSPRWCPHCGKLPPQWEHVKQ